MVGFDERGAYTLNVPRGHNAYHMRVRRCAYRNQPHSAISGGAGLHSAVQLVLTEFSIFRAPYAGLTTMRPLATTRGGGQASAGSIGARICTLSIEQAPQHPRSSTQSPSSRQPYAFWKFPESPSTMTTPIATARTADSRCASSASRTRADSAVAPLPTPPS